MKPKIAASEIAFFLIPIVWLAGVLFAGPYNATFNGVMLILLYIVGIAMFLKRNNKIAYPFVIFLIYSLFSNAGQTLTRLLGFKNNINVDIYARYSDKLIGEMLLIQGMFIFCMCVGYIVFRRKREVSIVSPLLDNGSNLDLEDLLLALVTLIVAVSYITELSKRASLSYGDYYYDARGGVDSLMQYVYHVVIFGYILRHNGWKKKMAYCIMAVLAVMAIFIGSRSATLPMFVGCAFILLATQKGKVKFKLRYLALALVVLLVFAAFTELRDYAISDLNAEIVFDDFTVSPIQALVDIVDEMGGSARTVLSTMQAKKMGVTDSEGTILYAVLKGFVPVGALNMVGISEPAVGFLSEWVSEYGSGLFIEGKGWGYSIIAEIIYNFGTMGIFFSFIFGGAVALLENWMERLLKKGESFLAAGVLYLLGYAVFLARAEMALVSTRIRYTLYFAILLWLMKLFNIKLKWNREKKVKTGEDDGKD